MDLPEEERRVAVRARPCEVAGYFDASERLCSQDQSQRVKRGEVPEDFEAVMCLDVLRLGFATARSGEKRWRTTAVQDAGARHADSRNARSVVECASPLALWTERGESERRLERLSVACASTCDWYGGCGLEISAESAANDTRKRFMDFPAPMTDSDCAPA